MSRVVRGGPPPELMIFLLVLGVSLLIFGEYYYSSGRGVYGLSRADLPTLGGLVVLLVDGVLLVIWRVLQDRPLALEDSFRKDDPD